MAASTYDDKVWLNEDRKLQGIANDIRAAKSSGRNILVLTHFEATLAALETTLRDAAIESRAFSTFDLARLCQSDDAGDVLIGLARDFPARSAPSGKKDKSIQLSILIAEHYPLAVTDSAMLEAANVLPCAAQITFHNSLADPLLARFGAESVGGLFQRLGIKDTSFVSHILISSAIRSAQDRVARKVRDEMRTRSAAEWFNYNLPDNAA